MPISGKEMLRKYKKAGWVVVRQRGSHVRLEKKINEKVIKITIPMHPQLKSGTQTRKLK